MLDGKPHPLKAKTLEERRRRKELAEKEWKEALEAGDLEKARALQHQSHIFINILLKYRGNIVGGKRMMKFLGIDCGPNRLTLQTITEEEEKAMRTELEDIGFFDFCNTARAFSLRSDLFFFKIKRSCWISLTALSVTAVCVFMDRNRPSWLEILELT